MNTSTSSKTRRLAAAASALAALALVGTACSSSDDASDSSASASIGMVPASSVPTQLSVAAGSDGSSTPTAISTSTELTTVDGKTITIGNEAIAASYGQRGGPQGYLGKPLGPVVSLPSGGSFITLEHGSLYQNPDSGKVFAVHGAIGDYWGTLGYETGRLGYPTSEETKVDGGLAQTFQKGTLTFTDGKVTVS